MESLEKLLEKEADKLFEEWKKLPGGELLVKAQELLLSDDIEDYPNKPYLVTTQNQRYLAEVLPKNAQKVCVILGAGDTIFQLVSQGIKEIVALEINDVQEVVFKLRKAALLSLPSNIAFENFLIDIKSKDFLSEEILDKVEEGFRDDEEAYLFWYDFLKFNEKEEMCEYFFKGGLDHTDLYKCRYALLYLKRRALYNRVQQNLAKTDLQIIVKDAVEYLTKTTELFDFIDITNILMFVYQVQCKDDQVKFREVVKELRIIYNKNVKPGGTMVLDYMFSITPRELESSKSKVTDNDVFALKTETMYKDIYRALKEEFDDLETLQISSSCTAVPLTGSTDTVLYVKKK